MKRLLIGAATVMLLLSGLGLLTAAPASATTTYVTPDGRCWLDVDHGTYAGVAFAKAHVNITVAGNSCDRQSYVVVSSTSGQGPVCNLLAQTVTGGFGAGAKCVALATGVGAWDFWSQSQVNGPIGSWLVNFCSTAGSCSTRSG